MEFSEARSPSSLAGRLCTDFDDDYNINIMMFCAQVEVSTKAALRKTSVK